MSKTRTDKNKHDTVYDSYLSYAKKSESKRMGYPLTGSINGFFTDHVWVKSKKNKPLLDNTKFGIQLDSLADTLLLNIGDPESSIADEKSRQTNGIFYPEDIENTIIKILARHFGTDYQHIKGYVTPGGTEANLACIWWLRDALLNQYKDKYSHSSKLILFSSNATHYSCKKICRILNIELREINTKANGQLDVEQLQTHLRKHLLINPEQPFIVWLNAGTTIAGAVDDIKQVNQLLAKETNENHLFGIHTDGAILGITLPYLNPEYNNLFQYTDTLTMSGHKLLATTSACGVALAKRNIVNRAFYKADNSIGYVHGIKDITVSGGRSSLPIFQLHHMLTTLEIGLNATKFKTLLNTCLINASYLAEELSRLIGYDLVLYNKNQFNIVFQLVMSPDNAERLKDQYTLMSLPNNSACISVFSHVDKPLINEFLHDYKTYFHHYCEPSVLRAKL